MKAGRAEVSQEHPSPWWFSLAWPAVGGWLASLTLTLGKQAQAALARPPSPQLTAG